MNFRRLITAMALLALFVGLASAQIGGGGTTPLTCSATVSAPPLLRSEGITDLIGDIVITCTGGTPLAPGAVIPTVNVTVSLQTNVTSRILSTSGGLSVSEALLLIDEPGSSLSGALPQQNICTTPTVGAGSTGCVQFNVGGSATGTCTTVTAGVCTAGLGTNATISNLFQGTVSSNQVTFNGVPVNPPATAGLQRIFRITNVRANVNGLGGGGLAGTTPLLASIAISPFSGLPVNNPVQTAGFIQKGLNTSVLATDDSSAIGTNGTALNQCASQTRTNVAFLRFSENFATAFKTRVQTTATYTGQAGQGVAVQNVPGNVYNSESGFIPTGSNIGLADFGTRLKAVFNNIPSGARIFVTQSNIPNPTEVTTATAGSTTPLTVAVVSETAPDTNGTAPFVSGTTTAGGNRVLELPVVNGSATAVWEVIQSNPNALESYDFGVYITYTANPGSNSPAVGTGTVNLSFAPTSTATSASASATIPRFADTSSAKNFFSIVICQTSLLYPFVTNQAGFDTGIAIANTSTDPFGTGPQAGTCTLNFFGASAPSAAVTTPSVASGTVFATLASTSAPGFQGYMIAVCNFQYAHGFAFVSDVGARNLAMGYLPLVINGTRGQTTAEALEQ